MQISVIIPAWNAECTLGTCVHSVTASAPPNSEIVIAVDGGCHDATMATARELANKIETHRLVVVTHDDGGNYGAGSTRNLGISKATGDVLAFLDVDDRYLPCRFETALNFMQDENCECVVGATRVEVDDGDSAGEWGKPSLLFVPAISRQQLLESTASAKSWHFNALTIRKSVVRRIGVLNPGLRLGQDLEWFIRIAANCQIMDTGPEPVAVYRRHSLNRSGEGQYEVRMNVTQSVLRNFRKNGPRQFIKPLQEKFVSSAFDTSKAMIDQRLFDRNRRYMLQLLRISPRLLTSRLFWKRLMGYP